MKIKSIFTSLGFMFILSGCVGVVERSAAIYVEPRPTVIIEPTTEVVIIHGIPTRRVIVSPRPCPRPIVIRRHR